jgi:hypothetical protein
MLWITKIIPSNSSLYSSGRSISWKRRCMKSQERWRRARSNLTSEVYSFTPSLSSLVD